MVAGWMLYFVLVSGLMLGAGLLLEKAARRLGLPQRGVWIAALAGSLAIPLLIRAWPVSIGASARGSAAAGEITPAASPDTGWETMPQWPPLSSLASSLDPVFIGAWIGATLVLLMLAALAAFRLRRAMREWVPEMVASRRILVSESTGPAVVGFLGCEIVLPRWAWAGDPAVRRMMLAHEEEHLRARDPLLLLVAGSLAVLLPWNLPLWWQLRRLRLAVEVDCDARVLGAGSDLRAYATLLLEVGRRRAGLDPALLAFAAPASFLERRILVMTRGRSRGRGWLPAAGSALLAAALVAGACGLDQPEQRSPLEGDAEAPTPTSDTPARMEADASSGSAAPADRSQTDEASRFSVSDRDDVEGQAGIEEGSAPDGRRGTLPTVTETPRSGSTPTGDAPSASNRSSLADAPAFTPRDVEPSLTNRSEFGRALERAYPATLKDAGMGGRVVLWVFIARNGTVGDVRIYKSSGYTALDEAAEGVMRTARFSPAENRGESVPVWVALPVTFQTPD